MENNNIFKRKKKWLVYSKNFLTAKKEMGFKKNTILLIKYTFLAYFLYTFTVGNAIHSYPSL